MTSMRAARLHEWGAAPVIEEVPTPSAGPGETLLRVEASGVGHLDLSVAGGRFDVHPSLPYIPGVEAVGRVEESDRFAPGDRVLLRGGGPGLVRDGAWAELVVAPSDTLASVPDGLEAPLAAVFATPATTAHVALFDVGGATSDDTVIVTGAAGAVGSLVVQLALDAGIQVIAAVGREQHRDRVPGDVRVVIGRGSEIVATLAPERPTLLVDTVGGQGLAALIGAVARGGRAALVGYTAGTACTLELPSFLLDEVALLPVSMIRRGARARTLLPSLGERFADGRLRLHVETVALDDAADAVRRLRSGEVTGRLALLMP